MKWINCLFLQLGFQNRHDTEVSERDFFGV